MIKFLYERISSFKHAFNGLKDVLLTEHNAYVHAVVTLIVFLAAIWVQLSTVETAFIVIVITLVWVAEAFNTVFEVIVNMVSPDYNDVAKRAKDIAAGAVLITTFGAVLVGIIILGPPLADKLGW